MKRLNFKKLGKRLQAARNARGFTQDDIAKAVGGTKQLVSHWENGRCEITLRDIVILSRYYGVTIDALLTGKSLNS